MAGKPRVPESEWPSICVRYSNKEDVGSIATPYGIKREAVYRILRKCGVSVEKRGGSPPIEEAICSLICDLYKSKRGASSIAKQFGIDKRSVYNILIRAGIGTRPRSNRTGDSYGVPKYQADWIAKERPGYTRGPKGSFNRDAFKELDEQTCYWAGYLITDGCIGAYDGRSFRLYLPQARKHREQCEKLKAYLQSELLTIDHEQETFGKMREFSRASFTLPDEVAQRLLKLGIRPAKTAFAKAHTSLCSSPHFWRGVVDGDGSCYTNKTSMNSSSPRLANQYRRFLTDCAGILKSDAHIYRNQVGVWSVRIWGVYGSRTTGMLYDKANPECRLEGKYTRACIFADKYRAQYQKETAGG